MSAVGPTAALVTRFPLFPMNGHRQTNPGWSDWCREETHALQQKSPTRSPRRHVDDQFELGRLFNRQVGRLRTLENRPAARRYKSRISARERQLIDPDAHERCVSRCRLSCARPGSSERGKEMGGPRYGGVSIYSTRMFSELRCGLQNGHNRCKSRPQTANSC